MSTWHAPGLGTIAMMNPWERQIGKHSVWAAVVVTVAIVGVGRLTLGVPSVTRLDARQSLPTAITPESTGGPYQVGERIPEIQGVDFSRAPATLVMVLRESCPYCTASMDFYKRLADSARRGRLVVLSSDSPDVITAYLEKHGFEPDQTLSTSSSLRISGTPTLLLVDRDRVIRQSWSGRIERPSQERDVLNALR
jgi:peroxiredoxin